MVGENNSSLGGMTLLSWRYRPPLACSLPMAKEPSMMGERALAGRVEDIFKSGLLLALRRILEALGESSGLGPNAAEGLLVVEGEGVTLAGSWGGGVGGAGSSAGRDSWWFSQVSTFFRLLEVWRGGGRSLDSTPFSNGLPTVLFFPSKVGVSIPIGSGLLGEEMWSGDQGGQLVLCLSAACGEKVGVARVVEVGLCK